VSAAGVADGNETGGTVSPAGRFIGCSADIATSVMRPLEQSSAGLLVQDGLQIHAPDKSASLLGSARSRSVALASV